MMVVGMLVGVAPVAVLHASAVTTVAVGMAVGAVVVRRRHISGRWNSHDVVARRFVRKKLTSEDRG